MDVLETIAQARDALTVKRVYGDPVERDGVTLLPAARVMGCAGGGGGEGPEGQGRGSGSGFGLHARPVGAWVIEGGRVSWRPAVDLNRVLVVGLLSLLAVRSTLRMLARALR